MRALAVPDYDLVREHHPDSYACAHLSAAERHARFQSITGAYETLSGRRAAESDAYLTEILRRRATPRRPKKTWAEEYEFPGKGNRHGEGREWMSNESDKRKDTLLMIGGGLVRVL
jgi:DnaJ-class molecular chaperone